MQRSQNQLMELLSQTDISVPELFEQPDILPKIKSKLQLFVDFLLRNSQFTKHMIALGIKAPMHNNENMKKVAYVAADILTCDHDIIADIFIQSSKYRIRLYSEDDDFICEDIVTDGKTGQLVVADKTNEEEASPRDAFSKKYVYLLDLLDYLNQNERDENCVNYLSKVLNTVIRTKPQETFEFFREKQEILDKIIRHTSEHPCLALTLVKLVHELEEKQYREEKTLIVRKIIGQMQANVNSCLAFSNYLQFVEQIFNKNKYRGEEIDQIKFISQPLVDSDIVNWTLATLLDAHANGRSEAAENCVRYLLKVVERMNVDDEEDPYSYTQPENQTPTMDFQVDRIFQKFRQLLGMIDQITRASYNKTAVVDYLDLLIAIIKNKRFSQIKFEATQSLPALLKVISAETPISGGIIQNRYVTLLQKLFGPENAKTVTPQTIKLIDQLLASDKNEQGKCYIEKLSIVLLHEKSKSKSRLQQVSEKYRSLLGQTEYMEKRQRNIEELKFAKSNQFLEEVTEGSENETPPPMILDGIDMSFDDSGFLKHKQQEEQSMSSPGILKNGNGLNLELLNHRIQMKKNEKSQKEVTKEDPGARNGKDEAKEGSKEERKEEKIVLKQEREQEEGIGKCGPVKKEQVDYYTKHLILF